MGDYHIDVVPFDDALAAASSQYDVLLGDYGSLTEAASGLQAALKESSVQEAFAGALEAFISKYQRATLNRVRGATQTAFSVRNLFLDAEAQMVGTTKAEHVDAEGRTPEQRAIEKAWLEMDRAGHAQADFSAVGPEEQ